MKLRDKNTGRLVLLETATGHKRPGFVLRALPHGSRRASPGHEAAIIGDDAFDWVRETDVDVVGLPEPN